MNFCMIGLCVGVEPQGLLVVVKLLKLTLIEFRKYV